MSHDFSMNTHIHFQFQRIICHQIPTELHDLNMNTHKHFQFQHIICHQIPVELHDFNMNTHMYFLTQIILANPITMAGPLPCFVLSILFIFSLLDILEIGLISSMFPCPLS